MKALIVSKALVAATYRQKLAEIARLGVDLTAVVPPEWREAGSVQHLEPADDSAYRLIVSPLRWNGHFHLHYYPELPRIIRNLQPDVIHLDEEPYNLATYLGMRSAASRPTLFFSWQNIPRRYPPPFSWIEQRVYRSAAGAIAGSPTVSAVLRSKAFTKPIWVIPQFGVDPRVFSPGETRDGPFTVGFLNRLVPAKGPDLMVAAFAQLPTDARLVIVGDGPLRSALETEIARRGLTHQVTLTPRIPSTQVPHLLRSLDVVVLPSVTTPGWKEQFGRILIEAMASGVPVVGSDSGEIPSVIGDAGVVVPEGNADQLAAALHRLYARASLRRQLAAAGRERVLSRFTNPRIAEQTVEAYRGVLASAATR